jgi:hypothetical protein
MKSRFPQFGRVIGLSAAGELLEGFIDVNGQSDRCG